MRRVTFGLLLILSLALTASVASAQSGTSGAIAGVARDTTGALLPGVTVEAASPALIEKVRVATTDAQGNYKITDLRPGAYSVTFTLPGFSTFKREGIELTTGFTATANAELKVGSLEETVTVTGGSPVVDIQNVRTQTVLSREVLDTLPAPQTINGFATLTLGASVQGGLGGVQVVDVGGSKGDSSASLSIHGMRTNDQRQTVDGMSANNIALGGGRRSYLLNQIAVQEMVLATGASSAETETGGMVMNAVPKDGGNTFKLHFNGAFTNSELQAANIDDAIRAAGVSSVPGVDQIYDWGVGLGGRIIQDKLWFYSANRWWGATENQPGIFYNASTNPLFYVPDTSRPAYSDTHSWDIAGRITWQAASKHKITVSESRQNTCFCYQGVSATTAPESASNIQYEPMWLTQATWSNPASNRLLFEAGFSYGHFPTVFGLDQPFPGAIGVRELSTGLAYAGVGTATGCCFSPNSDLAKLSPLNQRFSASYVVGSHAFKVGEQLLEGFQTIHQDNPQQLGYTFLNARPNGITQQAGPFYGKTRIRSLGFYAQDQWTMKRLTLNLGARFDHFTGWVPAGTREAGRFTTTFAYDRVDNVPNFKDVSPRVGAAYDLFGNGKTAIKGSFGRYVTGVGTELAVANHPAVNVVIASTRTWNDANGDFAPDCNLNSLDGNGECGPLANRLFGQPFRNTFYDSDTLQGWGKRGYSWQGSVSVQHELGGGVALNVGYFRTQYGNFTVTQNELVTASDFTSYCVTGPTDSRLPGGGANRVCGLYDVNPARFGQVRNLIVQSSEFGDQEERFDGVDIGANARFGGGGLIQGGVSLGRQTVDTCYQNSRPDITATNFSTGAATTGLPRTDEFCRVAPPWSAGTQFKLNGVYPVRWGLEPSFTFQNLPGAFVSATYNAPNSVIVPALGRNLAACGAAATCTATAPVSLVPPATSFLDRITLLDLRLTKSFRVGTSRVRGMLDVYNVFNGNTVLNVNATYGAAWLRPLSLVGGRLFKFGAQVDF